MIQNSNVYKRSAVTSVSTSGPIRVGFVGLVWKKGWAFKAHYPAILQLPSQYQITALYDNDMSTGQRTVKNLKLNNAIVFSSLENFASYSDIDMIVVSTQVCKNHETVISIMKHSITNKHLKYLFIEWPLGCSLQEAEELYETSVTRGIQTIIALQGRKSPYILRAKELVSQGYLGSINSIELAANAGWFGDERFAKSPSYIYEQGKGVDLVTTTFAHTIDLLQYIIGSYHSQINAMVFRNISKQQIIAENGNQTEQIALKTVPDHLLFQGSLESGNIPISCSIKGGKPLKKFTKNLVIDIHGSKGDLKLEGEAGFAEMANLILFYNGIKPLTTYDEFEKELYNPNKEIYEVYHLKNYNAVMGNMYKLYQSVADFHFNTMKDSHLPSQFKMQKFEVEGFPTLWDALVLHKLLDKVYESDKSKATLDIRNLAEST